MSRVSPPPPVSVLVCLAVGVSVVQAQQPAKGLAIEPVASPDHFLQLIAPDLGTSWYLCFPERVLADPENILVDHHDTPAFWTNRTANQLALEASTPTIELQGRVQPVRGGALLVFTITNRSNWVLRNVVGHVCLSHDHLDPRGPETFADGLHNRTFIVTERGLVNLKDIDRGGPPDGIRSHYLLAGARPISFFLLPGPAQAFWGKLSGVRAVDPWIAGTSASGAWTIGFWWEKAAELFQNSDGTNRCIHSDPAFGDLAPAQTVTIRGRVDLVQGSAADALRLYRQERRALQP